VRLASVAAGFELLDQILDQATAPMAGSPGAR